MQRFPTWGLRPLWGLKNPILISDIYTTISKSGKSQLYSSNKNNVIDGVSTAWGTVVKGQSTMKVENHCSQASSAHLNFWKPTALFCVHIDLLN